MSRALDGYTDYIHRHKGAAADSRAALAAYRAEHKEMDPARTRLDFPRAKATWHNPHWRVLAWAQTAIHYACAYEDAWRRDAHVPATLFMLRASRALEKAKAAMPPQRGFLMRRTPRPALDGAMRRALDLYVDEAEQILRARLDSTYDDRCEDDSDEPSRSTNAGRV